MAHTLSASEAFELHKAAVTRDFVAKPRLGTYTFLAPHKIDADASLPLFFF